MRADSTNTGISAMRYSAVMMTLLSPISTVLVGCKILNHVDDNDLECTPGQIRADSAKTALCALTCRRAQKACLKARWPDERLQQG